MARTVYAQQDDTLDALVYRQFGRTAGLVEQTLLLNPKLANTPILAIGTAVIVPAYHQIKIVTDKTTLQLWD